MPKIVWDETGKKLFETGLDRGVLYVQNESGVYQKGEGWNGLTKVTESPEGGSATTIYANNAAYGQIRSAEKFKGNISAYTYPESFGLCDGSLVAAKGLLVTGQSRRGFGLTYRTLIASDSAGTNAGYQIHIVYGASIAPSSKDRNTIGESVEASTFSWDFETVAVEVPGFTNTSHLIVDSTKADAGKLSQLEDLLYGSNSGDAKLPTPKEIIDLLGPAAVGTTSKPAVGG